MSTRNEMSVSYRLISTLFDHDDLTALIGITPTYARNIDDLHTIRRGRHIYHRSSMWQIGTPELPRNDVRVEIERLFSLLEPAWSRLCDLGTLYDANLWLYLGFHSDQPPPVCIIPPDLVQRIVDLHAHVDIDTYCLDQDDLELSPPSNHFGQVMIEQNSITCTYALNGTDLDPQEVTSRTRLIPSRTWRAGENEQESPGGWEFDARRVMRGLFGVRDALPALMDELLPAWPALCDLGRIHSATVTIAPCDHSGEQSGGMSLDVPLLQRLVDLNATLVIRFDCRHSDLLYVDDTSMIDHSS